MVLKIPLKGLEKPEKGRENLLRLEKPSLENFTT